MSRLGWQELMSIHSIVSSSDSLLNVHHQLHVSLSCVALNSLEEQIDHILEIRFDKFSTYSQCERLNNFPSENDFE